MICLRSHHQRTLCYSLSVGAVVTRVTSRWGERFIALLVVVDNAQTAMDFGDVDPVQTCHASWINSPTSNRLDLLCSKRCHLGLIFQVDRIDMPSISLAPVCKCLLGYSVFNQSYQNFKSIQKKMSTWIDSIWIFFFVNEPRQAFTLVCFRWLFD